MKAGWLTSEFLLSIITIVCATLLVAFDKDISGSWATAVAAAVGGYNLSRGAAKFNPPKDSDSPVD